LKGGGREEASCDLSGGYDSFVEREVGVRLLVKRGSIRPSRRGRKNDRGEGKKGHNVETEDYEAKRKNGFLYGKPPAWKVETQTL